MGDEHLDTILAIESDEVIKFSVEDLVPIPSESEGIPDTMCDVHLVNNPTPLEAKYHFEIVINSNNDYSSSDDDSLYNENIKSKHYNLTPSFEFLTKSSSTSPKSFLEETNTVDNSLPEFENFCFDLEEISSGSTTTHSDITLPDYEAFSFSDDHIEKISSGSERKTRKGQNRIKTGQTREAWRSPEKSKPITVNKARKREENTVQGTNSDES
nr:hypothetical protein [Tanacetum cinerariifolium]